MPPSGLSNSCHTPAGTKMLSSRLQNRVDCCLFLKRNSNTAIICWKKFEKSKTFSGEIFLVNGQIVSVFEIKIPHIFLQSQLTLAQKRLCNSQFYNKNYCFESHLPIGKYNDFSKRKKSARELCDKDYISKSCCSLVRA